MGLFDMLKGGLQYNKMAKAIGVAIEKLDLYDFSHDERYIYSAAWFCRVGVFDTLEKYNFGMTATIRVPIDGHMEKMILNEALLRSYGGLSRRVAYLSEEVQQNVSEIMERGDFFYQIDKQISYEQKKGFC